MSPHAAVFLFVPGCPVQEDERNSTEGRATPQSALDPRAQTGSLLTSSSPIGPDVVTGTEAGRARLHEGQEKAASLPRPPSSSTSPFQGLLRPTSHPRRRTVAGDTDREAPLFPEETTNNRADTSGAAHLADAPVSASQRTRPYFQNTFSLGTFHTSQSTSTKSYKFPQTQAPVKASAASSDVASVAASRTSELFTTSRDYPSVSGSLAPSLTSPMPDLPSGTPWRAETTLNPHDVSLAPGEKEPNSWRSRTGTHRFPSDLVSAATSGPLKTPTAQQKGAGGSGATASTLSSGVRSPVRLGATGLTVLPTPAEASSSHPDSSDNGSAASVTPNAAAYTSTSESSATSASIQASPTSSLLSTALATRSVLSYVTPPFTQTSKGRSPRPTAPRDWESVSVLPDWILTTPPAAPAEGDVAQNAAATESNSGSESQTPGPTFTRLRHQPPTGSLTPVPSSASTPSHQLHLQTSSPSTHMATTAASGRSDAPGPSPGKSSTSHSPRQAATRKSHNLRTPTHLTHPTAAVSEHKPREEKEKSWQWLSSSTPGGSSQEAGTPVPENPTAPSSDAPASTPSHTPRFFIVPDQAAAIKGGQSISRHL